MKKIMATILWTLAFTTFCSTEAALSCAQTHPAFAEGNSVTAELVTPNSYEQYLDLNTPCDVATTQGYLAIADGNTLYLFDKADNVYRQYEHTAPIQKVEFDGRGNLYFISELELYKFTPEDMKNGEAATSLSINCKGLFAIENDVLCYYTSLNALKFYSLSTNTALGEVSLQSPLQSESPLAFGKDGLYCVTESETTANGYTVYAINLQTYGLTKITNINEKLRSLTVANNLLCFVTEKGDFFSYNVTDLSGKDDIAKVTPITSDKNGYVSISSFNGNVYAVRGNIIRHYSVENACFTDYEIGASSSSVNRLNGASELTLNGNKLFIADDENGRIAVYDTESQTFGADIRTELDNPYLESYQTTLLVSSSTEAIVYSLAKRSYGEALLTVNMENQAAEGKIVGTASVYGRYYLLTENNYCYTLSKESGEWAWSKTQKNTQTLRAVAFTADVYGSLYVSYDDDTTYRYTEKELLSADARGQKVLEGLQSPQKISVDYETDLYALVDGTIYEYSQNEGGMYELESSYTPNYHLVNDNSPSLASFAFGLDTEFTYLLYEGDYIVKTDELKIPAVNPIPVGNAAELIFGDTHQDFEVVNVAIDSILIEFDVTKLQDSTQFPYVAFERTQEMQTALKLGEEGEYSLVAIAKQRTGEFKTCLVLTTSCEALTQGLYKTDYETPTSGYLTNDVFLYKFPYVHDALTLGTLKGGEKVSLLGEVMKLDHAYYEISVTDENGMVKIGYVPKSYVTAFDGRTPQPETVVNGDTETDTDGVWRMVYLILGFGTILILVDYLILHKWKDSED